MASITGKEIIVPPFPGLMGAYGTALKIKENIEFGILERSSFTLEDLIQKEFSSGKSFICHDKVNNCDRGCEINVYTVNGKKFPFGGSCNKYYNKSSRISDNWEHLDYVRKRGHII